MDTATYISKKCGMVTIKVENNQMPLLPLFSPVYNSTRPYSQTKSNTQRALMLPDEIMRMDNRESLVLLRGQKPLKLYKITPDEHPRFQCLHDVRVSDYIPQWRRWEETPKSSTEACGRKEAPVPPPAATESVPHEETPPPTPPIGSELSPPPPAAAPKEPIQPKDGRAPVQKYDYGLLDTEPEDRSTQLPATDSPYGAFDLIEMSPDEVGGP